MYVDIVANQSPNIVAVPQGRTTPHPDSEPERYAQKALGIRFLLRLSSPHTYFEKSLVPRVGLEPTCSYEPRILSPLRIPFRHRGIFLEVASGVEPE